MLFLVATHNVLLYITWSASRPGCVRRSHSVWQLNQQGCRKNWFMTGPGPTVLSINPYRLIAARGPHQICPFIDYNYMSARSAPVFWFLCWILSISFIFGKFLINHRDLSQIGKITRRRINFFEFRILHWNLSTNLKGSLKRVTALFWANYV